MARHATCSWSGLTRTLSAIACLAASAGALAQGRQVMVMEDSDGGAQYMHLSLPDLQELREPDYRRSDLPIFVEELQLSETQRVLVRELIEQYLEQFSMLVREKLGTRGEEGLDVQLAEGPDGTPGVAMTLGGGPDGDLSKLMQDAVKSLRSASGEAGEETGGEVEVMIGTTISIGGEENETEGAGGGVGALAEGGDGPSVAIGLSGPEGTELPEEVRKKLEARAQEIAEKIQKRMAEQMEAGGVGGAMTPGERFERQRLSVEELTARAEELEKEKKRLARQFVADTQAQLEEEQIPLWPGLERTLTRIKTLPKGRLDGERTDLLAILDALELDEDDLAAIADATEGYELSLHQALVRRNESIPELQDKIDDALGEARFERALSLIDRATATRIGVRRVNDTYTEAIAANVDDENAAEFRSRVNERSYPRVYRKTHGDRAFDAIGKLGTIDDETRTVVEDLEQAYRIERDRVDAEIVRAIRSEQPEQPKRSIERLQRSSTAEIGGPRPIIPKDGEAQAKAFAKRRELDRKYRDLLTNVLTPEQAAVLPQIPDGPQRQIFFQSGPVD